MTRYHQFTRSPYYGVVGALPLLVIYEVLLLLSGHLSPLTVRNAGDVWLRMLFESLEFNPQHATAVMILLLLLAIPVVKRQGISLEPLYFGGILLEAGVYALILGPLILTVLSWVGWGLGQAAGALPFMAAIVQDAPIAAQVMMPITITTTQKLALSLGAGLFEEFLFRVVLLGALLGLARAVLANWLAVIIATLAASFLFSLAHYVGSFGDPFTLGSFLYRWIAGLIFTVLYYSRGFAVTAYTHALYDIWVIAL